jgi:hypothetical protein
MDTVDTIQVRSHRRAQWFWLDNNLIDVHAQALGPIGVALYVVLARYCNHKTGQCYPSLTRLSAQLGINRLTASRYLQRLVDCRLITIEPRPGHPALVTLLDMAEPPAAPQESTGCLPGKQVPQQGANDVSRGANDVSRGANDVSRGCLPGNHEPDSSNQNNLTREDDAQNVYDIGEGKGQDTISHGTHSRRPQCAVARGLSGIDRPGAAIPRGRRVVAVVYHSARAGGSHVGVVGVR